MKSLLKLFVLSLMIVNLLSAQNPNPTIETTKLSENLYEFFIYINNNNSVNIYALIGQDGILMIDAGFTNTTDLVKSELKKLSDKKVKWIINTHYDGDHTLGNASLGVDASIIAHQACRDILLAAGNFPKNGLPNVTFQDSAKIFFNGEEIVLKYLPGHTSTDIIVHFKNSNIVFLGDLIFSDSFPLVHPDGNIYLLEKNLNLLPGMFREDTRIMVGHGRELKTKELKPYFEMYMQTKNLVLKAIKDGKSPEEAKKSGVLKDWEKWNSTIFPTTHTSNSWIDNLYSALDEGKELSAYQTLKKIYDQSGLNAMISKYREIYSSKKQYFLENDFNNWGYALLTGNKIPDAIEVFKINTEVFPESANVFDSLGEAYMTNGDKDLAIINYKKSIEINPGNDNAKKMIENMQSGK